jgi:hypothetical protein
MEMVNYATGASVGAQTFVYSFSPSDYSFLIAPLTEPKFLPRYQPYFERRRAEGKYLLPKT